MNAKETEAFYDWWTDKPLTVPLEVWQAACEWMKAKSKEEAEERYIIACRKIPMYFGHSEKKDIKEVVRLAAFGKEGER